MAVAAASRAGTRYDDALRVTAPAAAVGDLSSKEAAFTPTLRGTGPVAGQLVLADDGEPTVDRDDATRSDACQDLENGVAVSGRIVLVRRGGCDFQDKVERAEAAGAVAVVVYSNAGAPITMSGERDSVGIPAVMISETDGESLATRLDAGETVEVRLEKGRIVARSDAGNIIAGQSARGPNPLLPDVLKPDVAAPGTDILGAQTPDVANGVRGEAYQYLSGTSMAVPHVAGVAALLMEAHPDWSPAAIRSALVTTARQDLRKDDGATAADPFDSGGGHIVPNAAIAPGLVYDAGPEDYDAFACGAGIPRVSEEECAALVEAGYPTAAWDLNLPSVAVGDLVTSREVRRRVTNVGEAAQYEAVFTAPPGVAVSVSPATLSLATGETAEFSVTLSSLGNAARLGQWGFGSLTWTADGTNVRIPLAIRPEALAAPAVVSGAGESGTAQYAVGFGYAGAFTVRTAGLAAPDVFPGFVTDDPLNLYSIQTDDSALPDHTRRFRVPVPAGTAYLRIAVAGLDEGATDDLDLYVFCPAGLCPDGNELLASTSATSVEVIDILAPPPGEYVIDVHGYETDDVAGGDGANFEMGTWIVGATGGEGALASAAPGIASVGGTGEVVLDWQGLAPGQLYLGLVTHGDGERDLGQTLVEIVSD
jgi:hypothetical protein